MPERIEFCQKLGGTHAKTIQKFQQALGNDTMGKTLIKESYNHFKHFHASVESMYAKTDHPQDKTRSQLRRFGEQLWKTIL